MNRTERREFLRKWGMLSLKAACITALGFIVSTVLTAPFSASTGAVFSAPEKTDFTLSDFYAQVADRRPVRALSDRILIVDIDRADRNEIAELVSAVALCEPKAIGIDINFELPREDNSQVVGAVTSSSDLVLPLGLEKSHDSEDAYIVADRPFFYDSIPGLSYGSANLPGKYAKSTIREFPVAFPLERGDTLLSFVAAVARKADPEAYADLMWRGNKIETIDYASREIPVVSIDEFYEQPEKAVGKVVLVGAVNEAGDTHATPVSSSMAGLTIHSHALSTVLERNYFTNVPGWVDYVIASVMCFIIVLLNIGLTTKIKGFLLRVMQVAFVYIAISLGYSLYVDHHVVMDFSHTMLMIAFGFFAIDIWNGLIWAVELATSGWKRHKSKIKGLLPIKN